MLRELVGGSYWRSTTTAWMTREPLPAWEGLFGLGLEAQAARVEAARIPAGIAFNMLFIADPCLLFLVPGHALDLLSRSIHDAAKGDRAHDRGQEIRDRGLR